MVSLCVLRAFAQEIKPLPILIASELELDLSKERFPAPMVSVKMETFGMKTQAKKDKEPFVKRSLSAIKKGLPEIYEEEEKYKLKIKIPWGKKDLDIPFPRGFTNQPNPPPYSPAVAYQRSAIFPGWGQAYNRSYWKIPLFYGGYGVFVWWINFNNTRYRRFGTAYLLAIDGLDETRDEELSALYDEEGLRTQRNLYRSRRDNAYLLLAAWHAVQIAEAYVHAHLRGFDVSEDLSMKVNPDLIQIQSGVNTAGIYPGFSVSFTF